ncbi:hypothetical protein GFPCMMHI_03713 [Ensifer adhaerens]|nr:hypothetical protein [Ensifer adhaerens]
MNVRIQSSRPSPSFARVWVYTADVLWLFVMSASLVESYAYRYAGTLLLILSLILYARSKPRPSIDWQGWLCLAWGTYAFLRYVLQFALQADHPVGDHDVLFLMPLVFPPLAFLLFRCWSHLERLVAVYFGIALIVLLLSLRLSAILEGETVIPLIQHNQIHGAVCCGVILIGAIFWLLHYLTENTCNRTIKIYASVVSPCICALCLLGIYGAKSKGVWLSLLPVLPIVGFIAMRALKPRLVVPVALLLVALLGGGLYIVRNNVVHTAGPTIAATITMLKDAGSTEQIGSAVSHSIDSGATPIGMNQRLQLWANAWELFSTAPIFGWGSEWLELWPHTYYPNAGYTFMHNGYLEILIRYGLFGAAFLGVMLACFCFNVRRAASLRIIPNHAMHAYFLIILFFSFTILSNSNNRLASGESLSILTAAFALACRLKIRTYGGTAPLGVSGEVVPIA